MKRFFSLKRGQKFWIATTLMTKCGAIGCHDAFGNLYIIFPWARVMPYENRRT